MDIHPFKARASFPLIVPSIFLLSRILSCCHQDTPTARLGSPALHQGLQYWLQASLGHGQVTCLCLGGFLPVLATHFLPKALGQGIATWHWTHLSGQSDSVPSWKECQDFRRILVHLGSRLSHPLAR